MNGQYYFYSKTSVTESCKYESALRVSFCELRRCLSCLLTFHSCSGSDPFYLTITLETALPPISQGHSHLFIFFICLSVYVPPILPRDDLLLSITLMCLQLFISADFSSFLRYLFSFPSFELSANLKNISVFSLQLLIKC